MDLPPNHKQSIRKSPVRNKISRVISDINIQNASSGLISATLIVTGPAIVLLEAAANGNFTDQQAINWMFAVYFFGGLYGILMSLWHRKPIVGGHSLMGVAFLSTITAYIPYSQLIGGYFLSGLFIFLIGISGIFNRIMKWVPREVISAMLAGLVAGYVVRLVLSLQELPIVGGISLFSYFALMKYSKRIPPALGAVVVAIFTTLITQKLDLAETYLSSFLPTIQKPEFSLTALLSVAIPLSLLILSNDVAPGIGALKSAGYHPPVRRLVATSGVFSMVTSFLGGQCANVAGMASAICSGSDAGPKSSRYMAAVMSGGVTLVFGTLAWKVVPFIQSLPQALISMLAGFALISVLLSNLKEAFSGDQYNIGSLTAFVVALSNISFLQISAPVWAILCGAAVTGIMKK
ncbi:benzoate/H(+) symporter BenE family transporter [Aeribacillus sp. FSL K6-8394]|uniref:benzoate/H(+) symporter BenE family transporter n=1 Tax=Aeribacillus sp. FSL K6-8394 TaxID=2954570 RepID=UPI0030FBAA0D